jgi:hypothetical protein
MLCHSGITKPSFGPVELQMLHGILLDWCEERGCDWTASQHARPRRKPFPGSNAASGKEGGFSSFFAVFEPIYLMV